VYPAGGGFIECDRWDDAEYDLYFREDSSVRIRTI